MGCVPILLFFLAVTFFSSVINNESDNFLNLTWYFGDPAGSSASDGSLVAPSASQNTQANFAYPQVGLYVVSLRATDSLSPYRDVSVTLTINVTCTDGNDCTSEYF